MINNFRYRLQRNFLNAQGLRSKKKLVIIESDDWGAIRMPDKGVYTQLLNKGIVDDGDFFAKYDGLESKEDLGRLFETLSSIKDSCNNPSVLTANVIVGNPDFTKINQSEYTQYFFEPVEDTFVRERGFSITKSWNEGLSSNVFFPQLHGREHVNIAKWLKKLKNNQLNLLQAFQYKTYAVDHSIAAAFEANSLEEENSYQTIIDDACTIFEEIFKFPSKSFIAPNYTWPKSLESILKIKNIQYLQGTHWHSIPSYKHNKVQREFNTHGKKNSLGQTYLVRNCLFEPTLAPDKDYVDICLKHIDNAFYWKVPAIIASHRLNFVSVGGEKNRDKNLKALSQLLQSIIKKWPDVEFISTDQYCKILSEEESN